MQLCVDLVQLKGKAVRRRSSRRSLFCQGQIKVRRQLQIKVRGRFVSRLGLLLKYRFKAVGRRLIGARLSRHYSR